MTVNYRYYAASLRWPRYAPWPSVCLSVRPTVCSVCAHNVKTKGHMKKPAVFVMESRYLAAQNVCASAASIMKSKKTAYGFDCSL